MGRALLVIATLALAGVMLAGCAPPPPEPVAPAQPASPDLPPIKVGSMLDAEGALLGSMVIQMLEANGYRAVDKTKLGTPEVMRKALLAGELDATIDYTGSGQFYIEGQEGLPVWRYADTAHQEIKKLDKEQNNVDWLTPAPANNTELIAAKKDFLEVNGIATMEDFAKYVNDGQETKVIGSQSWVDSPLGLKGFEEAYGFKLRKDQVIARSDGVTAPMLEAVAKGTDGVNFSLAYGTDGQLADLGLLIIADPEGVPPAYGPAPVFRGEIIDAAPEIAEILKPVFESLYGTILQDLNKQVAFDGKDPKAVARDYLEARGFLK